MPELNLGFNFLDAIIIFIIIFYAFEGFSVGFVGAASDFLSFTLSFLASFKLYSFLGNILVNLFSLPHGISNAIGFFMAAIFIEIILNTFFKRILTNSTNSSLKLSRFLGIIPGVASSLVLLSFLLTLIISLPFSPFLKQIIETSKFGPKLVANAASVEKTLTSVFGGAIHDTLNFFTIEPRSDEIVSLNFKTSKFSIDEKGEKQMFDMINKERGKVGLKALSFDPEIREVAREHSKDMFLRGFFSHFNPDGLSPSDRLTKNGVLFRYTGENLALAPSVELAMQGLMNSPGHRANILSSNFGKVGIGVVDGGIYGEMFSQEFTD